MNALTKKIALSGLVMLLTACVHYPHHYNAYPGNGGYYPNNGYGNYQGHNHHHRPSAPRYWGHGGGRPGHHGGRGHDDD